MTEEPGAEDTPPGSTDKEPDIWVRDPLILAWAGEHLPELRRSVAENRALHWSLWTGLIAGLVADAGGFLLKSSVTTEPLLLVGDLIYTFGWALWTGVVVVVFFQLVPNAKTRQVKRSVEALEAALRDQVRAGSDQGPGDGQAQGDDQAPS